MKTSTFMLGAALVVALVLPGAGSAARAGTQLIPRSAVASVAQAKKAKAPAQQRSVTPRAVSKQRHGAARQVVILPYVFASGPQGAYAYLAGTENCASYTGCTDEELCIVWGVGCERLAAPAVTGAREAEEVQRP